MDFQLCCTSSLPRIWAIETLACSNQVDVSLLLDLLEKTPEISNDIGRNARELVSLKILESLFIRGSHANHLPSALNQTMRLDLSDSCEDVLRQILSETSRSHLTLSGPDMSKWDLQPFIEHKRSTLPKYALKQLKDAMLTGSHPISASLKEQSGLPVGSQADHEASGKDDNSNGITPRVEGNDTNDGYLWSRVLPDENLVAADRKRRASNDSAATRDGFAAKTHVESKRLNETAKDDDNECAATRGLVSPDKVLPRGKQIPRCDTEVNNKSKKEQRRDQNIEEAKGDKNGFCELKGTNEDSNVFEKNAPILGEVEEHVHISNDNDGKDDDWTDISMKGNASFNPQCTYSQDSLATNSYRDKALLAGRSKRHIEEERCSLEIRTRVEVMRQKRSSVDGDNRSASSKGLVGSDEVMPLEKQAPHRGVEVPNEKLDASMQYSKAENAENGREGLHGLITTNEDIDKSDQNVLRTFPIVSQAEDDMDISSDNDGYRDERTNIDTKKKTFLSSQCTYSQDSLATTNWRELNLCMKCNKGGKLSSCSSDSCPLVIHGSCLGSDASFDAGVKFYCPFCAYSRAISKYMEVKKKASLARKNLATFICLGPQHDSKKQSQISFKIEGDDLVQVGSLSNCNELNQGDVEKVNNHQYRKKLAYELAGPSELRTGYRSSFGGKAVDSTNRLAQGLSKDKQDGKGMRQVSKASGQQPLAGLEDCDSQGETTSQSEKHASVRSKKSVLCPPETDLPCERKCSRSSQSTDEEEISEEENESSDASKYIIKFRKQEGQNLCPAIPQLRRKRLPWTNEEEETLKEGMRLLCDPNDKIIPWTKILEFGYGVFPPSRGTMDLKDKWRNICKANPKSK